MAAPNYATDLVDITTAETITNWAALGGGASALAQNADSSMQGTYGVGKPVSAAEKGAVYNNGSGITFNTGEHTLVWAFLTTPGLAATLANRGLAIVIGNSTTAYVQYHVEGSDTYGAVGRVGKCYAIDQGTQSANTGSVPYRTNVGSPTNTKQYFGATANITATVKGENLVVDAIRRGTGLFVTAGDATTPATFSGVAAQSDAVANRWGLFTFVAGSNYELQGKFAVGENTSGVATAAYFSDSNKNILIIDTPHTTTVFNRISINHASTQVYLTNITIEAAGTNSPGLFEVLNASTVVDLTGCTFVKMGDFTLQAGVAADNCGWRGCGQITLNGASIQNSLIATSTATIALKAGNTPNNVQNTTFTSDGTGHAMEITGAAGEFTLVGLKFNGYAASNGSTGNEAVYVNIASGTVTLNITSGGSTPSIRTAGATVVVNSNVSVTLTGLKNPSEVRVFNAGTQTERSGTGAENVTSGTHTFSVPSGTSIDISILSLGYQNTRLLAYSTTADATIPISQVVDRQYANP